MTAWAAAGTLSLNALAPAERANALTTVLAAPGVDLDRLRGVCQRRFAVSLGAGSATCGAARSGSATLAT